MERLSGLDAGFLYLETPTLLMHTLKLVLLDRLEGPIDARASLIAATRSRLHLFPALRRRLLNIPVGLHHPLWIESSEVDLERHVLHAHIRAPGGAREMDEAIAEIASSPLDRSRPLWELWLLDGRADGALAVLLKIHHALADGGAAAQLIEAVASHDRFEPGPAKAAERWLPERTPSRSELLRAAATDRARELVALPALALRTAKSVLCLMGQHLSPRPPLPMFDAPRTSFNGSLSARRSLATVSLSLARALFVKTTARVTLNDVILALVGSALRSYLRGRGELPDRSLIASVPISSDSKGSHRLAGNRVSSLFTTLATDVVDPWERLLAIHAATLQAKHVQDVLGPGLLGAWLQYAMPKPLSWIVSEWSKRHVADLLPPPANVVVSSVHGPSEELFAQGMPLRAIYSVGPVLEGIGLNITVWSYLERLHFTVLACRDMMPDPHLITPLFEVALDDLEQRALAAPSHAPDRADDVLVA